MSFAALNLDLPKVVAGLTLTSFASLPFVAGRFEQKDISWSAVQGINLLAFGTAFWSVTQPTRETSNAKRSTKETSSPSPTERAHASLKSKTKKKKNRIPRVRTLLPPAGWSFLIWAPIFVGETLMVGTQVAISETSHLAPIIRQITGPYIIAKAFQILWNTSFKPEFQTGWYKYIAPLNLSGLAISLSLCHRAFTNENARNRFGTVDFMLNFLPLSLHFGWTTMTSLVNWNACVAVEKNVPPEYVAYFGHASVAVAAISGVGVTLRRRAPWYGAVIAWALSAVASGLTKRIEAVQNEKIKDDNFLLAADRQRTASMIGAVLCIGASSISIWGRNKVNQS